MRQRCRSRRKRARQRAAEHGYDQPARRREEVGLQGQSKVISSSVFSIFGFGHQLSFILLLRSFPYLGLRIKFSFILLRSFPYLGLRINFHSFFFFGLFHTWVCASSFHSLSSFSPSGISIFHFHSPTHSVLMFSLYSRIIFAKRNFHLSFVFPIFRCPLTSKIFHHVLITTRSSICISKCPNRLTSPVFSVMLLLLLILPLQSCF